MGNTKGEMQKRRITLEDGRYLIFYTFEDDGARASLPAFWHREGPVPQPPEIGEKPAQAQTQSQAEEE
jgi:hypothetical protein